MPDEVGDGDARGMHHQRSMDAMSTDEAAHYSDGSLMAVGYAMWIRMLRFCDVALPWMSLFTLLTGFDLMLGLTFRLLD